MQQIIQSLQQALLSEHIPSEQVQNIISSIDLNQLNLQDLPATTEYLSQFLGGFDLGENIINHINANLAENFANFGVGDITDLGIDQDGIVGNIQKMFGGFFGE